MIRRSSFAGEITHPIPHELRLACRRTGTALTKFALVVEIATQTCWVVEMCAHRSPLLLHCFVRYKMRCSTSKFGIGQAQNSNCTPLGLHRVAQKIGGGWPVGTVFRGRQPVGFTWQGRPEAPITNRILWLEGVEEGVNRGNHVDSHARYIYVHGTGEEPTLGRPASHGCVHLAARDLLPLYDLLPAGTLVWITRSCAAVHRVF